MRKVLLIGYGNPGRLDDGLGPALAEAVDALRLPGLDTDSDYQLTVEDAERASRYDAVIFADAAVRGREPFFFKEVGEADDLTFSTHSVEPELVLGMARRLFGAATRGYALGIRGYEFNAFGERLSDRARENLAAAVAFVRGIVEHDLIDEAALRGQDETTRHAPVLPSGQKNEETA